MPEAFIREDGTQVFIAGKRRTGSRPVRIRPERKLPSAVTFGDMFNTEGQQVGSKTRICGTATSGMLENLSDSGDFVVRGQSLVPLSEATPEERQKFEKQFGNF